MTTPGMVLADGIARFSLDPGRPVPLLDDATLERLRQAVAATGEAEANVLIVTGGTRGVFAAGADLAHLARLAPADALVFSRKGQDLFESLQSRPFISIAVVRGRCIGGAFDLAMACDVRLADTTASFSHPGPRLGFITGYGGTSRLPALVGRSARAVLAGGRVIDAEEASALGLVADLTLPGDLDRRTEEMASEMARVPAARIRCIKEVLARLSGSARRRRLERPLCLLAAIAGGAGMAGK